MKKCAFKIAQVVESNNEVNKARGGCKLADEVHNMRNVWMIVKYTRLPTNCLYE